MINLHLEDRAAYFPEFSSEVVPAVFRVPIHML